MTSCSERQEQNPLTLNEMHAVQSRGHIYLGIMSLLIHVPCLMCPYPGPHMMISGPVRDPLTFHPQGHRKIWMGSVYEASAITVSGSAGFWAPLMIQGESKVQRDVSSNQRRQVQWQSNLSEWIF
jgi:hypothetical protein